METRFEIHGGVCTVVQRFERGEQGEKHVHDFDHLSAVASGFFRVRRTNLKTLELGPGDTLVVNAGTEHQVTALTDGTWLCIHREGVVDQPTEQPAP